MEPPGPEAASAMLRDLLSNSRYRSKWEAEAGKNRPIAGKLNYDAIGRYIGSVVKAGKDPSRSAFDRSLRSKVRRALTGGTLTYETVVLFTEAFRFNEAEQLELKNLFFSGT